MTKQTETTLKIFSGQVCDGDVGIPTKLKGDGGETLHTGDIVISFVDGEIVGGLTVIVTDEVDGQHFVMGCKNVSILGDERWTYRRVKSYADVVNGEHWKDYGFSFREVAS